MNVTAQTTAADLARRFAQLGKPNEACQAYTLALKQKDDPDADLKMEAAMYLLQFSEDYRLPYDTFLDLYRQGLYEDDCLELMTEAFYLPNEKEMKSRYEKNCRLLSKYSYCFRTDFLPFEDLPLRFYPYDEVGYIPFHRQTGKFDPYVNFNYQVVSRNFFRDLDKPILAADVYSQYELEYLNDNVRKSEWVARDNHIYLHYTDWATFCSYLQVLEWRELLAQKKIVLLFENEVSQYPIDFNARFGIDYTQNSLKPVGIREVTRIIWHTQLSYHNGGDFFNEIFDSHPNLIYMSSQMYADIQSTVDGLREDLKAAHSLDDAQKIFAHWKNPALVEELYHMKNRTDKDLLVALYMAAGFSPYLDPASRITPVIFFQPHFSRADYTLEPLTNGDLMLKSDGHDRLRHAKFLQEFKYIKTFSPLRRITTSYAATVKFEANNSACNGDEDQINRSIMPNDPTIRILHRSYLIDEDDRYFRDSILVRFEDGKLNPKATFTSLCAFLDLPYTESMTYCSLRGQRDPLSYEGNARGFDTATVYRTYDEYAGNPELIYVEYFLQDVCQAYGYDLHYYDGTPMDEERLRDLTEHFDTFYNFAHHSFVRSRTYIAKLERKSDTLPETVEQSIEEVSQQRIRSYKDINFLNGKLLMLHGLRFVNEKGRPLKMMKKLELDPTLLEQPLYH